MNENRIDTSKIERMDVRQRIATHDATRDGIVAEKEAIEAPFRERIALIEDEMAAATQDVRQRLATHDATAEDDSGEVYAYDEDGRPERCCLSGLVLLEGDHLVESQMEDRYALAEVIPGWPTARQDLPDVEKAA